MAAWNIQSSSLAVVSVLVVLTSTVYGAGETTITIPMPTPPQPKHNDYMCVGVAAPHENSYIIGYEPRADPRVVHHMLMFGCPRLTSGHYWSCKSVMGVCQNQGMGKILYAWALNASGLQLPTGVGMQIGPSVDIRSLVIQIHYGFPENIADLSSTSQESLALHISTANPQFVAGIYLLGTGSSISPGKEQAFTDTACKFTGPNPIFPFAFRTHAHSLGRQIVGYIVKPSGEWELIGTRSPQDAQAFYPATSQELKAEEGDYLAMRCVFNTIGKSHFVDIGPNSEDEMCNFYIMYYTPNNGRPLNEDECWTDPPQRLHYPLTLPPLPALVSHTEHHHHSMGGGEEEEEHSDNGEDSKEHDDYKCPVPIPPGDPSLCPVPVPTTAPPFIEGMDSGPTHLGLIEAEDWGLNNVAIPGHTLGQVSAVAVDTEGNVHILHRGPVEWDQGSFNWDYTYRRIQQGPIKEPTILKFSPQSTPLSAWGEEVFYLPHGLTIDSQGAFWVTDVALHQVFKFPHAGASTPSMVLGNKFKPGHTFGHFCQPASVAVETNGVFYIADGYCNQRILQFDAQGTLLHTWDQAVASVSLFIPHKAVLDRHQTTLYVADRENRRVIAYDTTTGTGQLFSGPLEMSVYAIYMNMSSDWSMYGVFGGETGTQGFTLDHHGSLVNTWGPAEGFSKAHDLTVDPVNHAVYVTEIGPNRIWKFVPINSFSNDVPIIDVATAPPTSHEMHPPPASQPSQESPMSRPSEEPHPPQASQPSQAPHTTQPHMKHVIGTQDKSHTIPSSTSEPNTSADSNNTVIAESAGGNGPNEVVVQQATFNAGIFVAIVVVVLIIIIVIIGILREHKYLKKLRLYRGSRRNQNGAAAGGGVKVQTVGKKGNPLKSLLGPSRPGFSRLKTFDSDSEEEEFPVFNRV